METICENVQETQETFESTPTECLCKKNAPSKRLRLIMNAVGILIAVLATYIMISTDSKLYIFFWVCYSVLRRLMVKSKAHLKSA